MAEERLKAAMARERERIGRLSQERDQKIDRGLKRALSNRIRLAVITKEALEYALALVRGERERE